MNESLAGWLERNLRYGNAITQKHGEHDQQSHAGGGEGRATIKKDGRGYVSVDENTLKAINAKFKRETDSIPIEELDDDPSAYYAKVQTIRGKILKDHLYDAEVSVPAESTLSWNNAVDLAIEGVGNTQSGSGALRVVELADSALNTDASIRKNGKRMLSKYSGTDAVTGDNFPAGTEIYFSGGKTVVANRGNK